MRSAASPAAKAASSARTGSLGASKTTVVETASLLFLPARRNAAAARLPIASSDDESWPARLGSSCT